MKPHTKPNTTLFVAALLILLMCQGAMCQDTKPAKFRANGFQYAIKDGAGWSEWKSFNEGLSILIIVTQERVVTYTTDKQAYDFVEFQGKERLTEGDECFTYLCVDRYGKECTLQLIFLHSRGGSILLHVEYGKIKLLYGAELVE